MTYSTQNGVACGVLAAGLLLSTGSSVARGTGQGEVAITVPDGFEIERVAGPPLVNRPIVADFDEAGRLYVADSSGSNDRTEKQLQDRPHRIVRLEDTDGDGRFDTSVVFADRMMLPQGAMWLDGSLYVAAPPSIWKLTDTTGDGIADQREEWFQGGTLTGCANDLHGPYLGPDGWIYWTKGAFAEQTYERDGMPPLVTRAAHVFRRRPGDTSVDVVMTGGMDNPVDVAFTATGERLLTATFVEHPQRGQRDGLIHAIYGGAYGKAHAVLDGHPRTGGLMPVLAHLGPAVPAGLTRYASQAFGREYQDSFFAAMFNLRKVTRFALDAKGASFSAVASDFVVSTSRDFHPTDVIEDADGSLLVIDTGPWYKICCPTSQLARPEVLGGIYRVRRTAAPPPHDPRGTRLAWETLSSSVLVRLLEDERPAVQQRAIQRLATHAEAVPSLHQVLTSSASVAARRNAVWALARIDAAPARASVRLALVDREASVRHAAAHVAGLWRDGDAVPQLLAALETGGPAGRRAAAEALGRIGDTRAVGGLLAVASAEHDRVLEHSLTYALIEIGDRAAIHAASLRADSSRARRAALIALDQMKDGGLEPDAIVPLLDSADPVLRETAWWIADRHPEWGGRLAGYFEMRLKDRTSTGEDELQQRLARFAGSPEVQMLLARTAAAGDAATRITALEAMATARLKLLPPAWIAPLADALAAENPQIAGRAVAVIRAVGPAPEAASGLRAALIAIARDTARPIELRLNSLAAIPGGSTTLDADVFEVLLMGMDATQPPTVRLAAAASIEKARLDRAQLRRLAAAIEHAGPLELPRLLPPFDAADDEEVGFELLASLERSSGRSSVRAEILRPRLAKYPETVRRRGEDFLAAVHVDAARQAQRLDSMLAGLAEGDIRRGQTVFNSAKAACSSCHAIGYLGGTLGPDLTRIGEVRGARDLLEAIVYPSASFPRGFEPMAVTTSAGDVHMGVLRSERPDEVVLTTTAQEEIRVPRSAIADMRPGTVSLMPPGLDEQLTAQELADLLAFLKATRWGAN